VQVQVQLAIPPRMEQKATSRLDPEQLEKEDWNILLIRTLCLPVCWD
jgi:hypothetical protein